MLWVRRSLVIAVLTVAAVVTAGPLPDLNPLPEWFGGPSVFLGV